MSAMKKIGLLGGMSWESSIEYYRIVNEEVRDRLGGLHSADCLLRSVDFAPVEQMQRTGRWDEAGDLLQTINHDFGQVRHDNAEAAHKAYDRIELQLAKLQPLLSVLPR